MSRKDTIIIAVLINTGLLIVLFACALKSNFSDQEIAAHSELKSMGPVIKKEKMLSGEVDQPIHQLAQVPATTSPLQVSSTVAQHSFSSSSQPINFAEDLKTFSLPETSLPSVIPPAITKALPEVKKKTDCIEVKVKKGDVLEKIARQHHSTVDEILACNKLTSTHLRIGQSLKIPSQKINEKSSSPSTSTTAILPSVTTSDIKYYIVKNGDNPWTIAVKNHMKVEELLKLNDLDQEKARKLKPGDKLIIR